LVDRHDELDPKTCGFNLSDSEPSLSLGLNWGGDALEQTTWAGIDIGE
jgi:hypothetical protein